jgi:hypothetical protein
MLAPAQCNAPLVHARAALRERRRATGLTERASAAAQRPAKCATRCSVLDV